MKTYHVFRSAEGDNVYLGATRTLRGARRMAAQHARGDIGGEPEWMWETNRAAGGSCLAPPRCGTGDPVEWFGRGGVYCACLALDAGGAA